LHIKFRHRGITQKKAYNIDNSSFGRVEELKYLGTTLTNQNSVQEEIKTRQK
jgi:hypothetical protein